MKVQATKYRAGGEHAREGDIPAFFRWDDGSEYEVREISPGRYVRRYRGPLFNTLRWKEVVWAGDLQVG